MGQPRMMWQNVDRDGPVCVDQAWAHIVGVCLAAPVPKGVEAQNVGGGAQGLVRPALLGRTPRSDRR